jgi:Protein of unknown function (DUF3298).
MNISDLKKDYENTPIPDELDYIVRKTLKKEKNKMKRNQLAKSIVIGVAAAAVLLVTTVNISPTAASAMAEVPVLGSIVKVVTFREYTYKDDHHEVDVKVPQVKGLDNKELENHLNDKYLKENTKLYQDFVKKIGSDNLDQANLALFTDYKVVLNTDSLLVMANEKTEIAASGSESVHYDTIDKKNQLVLTLSSLFKDDSYIDVINKNIISQMKEQMAKDSNLMYFIANGKEDGFKTITSDQNFYINKDNKLVISFNEYDVAPGVMGIVEFVIPTDVIKNILVSDYYVK